MGAFLHGFLTFVLYLHLSLDHICTHTLMHGGKVLLHSGGHRELVCDEVWVYNSHALSLVCVVYVLWVWISKLHGYKVHCDVYRAE